MEITSLLPPAIAWLAMTLPRPRARVALAGGVITILGLASLMVAGAGDWRLVQLPPAYLGTTAGLLATGIGLALGAAAAAQYRSELPARPLLTLTAMIAVLGLGGWTVVPVAMAGGLLRTVVSGLVLGVTGWGLMLAGGRLRLAERLRRHDQRLFRRPEFSEIRKIQGRTPLLVTHLVLALIAFIAPHLLVLLLAAFGAVITGVLLVRGEARAPWSLITGLTLLAVVSGFTIAIAGETPLFLPALVDGPFSPAFELMAALGYFLAIWPLLGLFPFHGRWNGPATALAAAAVLLRVAVPTMSGGTEHWQPLIFPLIALSAWYAAGTNSVRLGLVAAATAGLITLRPSAEWAGVVLLAGEALVSTTRRFLPGRRLESGVVGLAAVVTLAVGVPLLTGALQAQTFYSVMLAAGLALMLLVPEPGPAR